MQTFQSSWASGIQKLPKLKNTTIFRPFHHSSPTYIPNIWQLIVNQAFRRYLYPILYIFIVRLNAICYKLLLFFTFYLCKTQKDKCPKHWPNLQAAGPEQHRAFVQIMILNICDSFGTWNKRRCDTWLT